MKRVILTQVHNREYCERLIQEVSQGRIIDSNDGLLWPIEALFVEPMDSNFVSSSNEDSMVKYVKTD